MNKDLGLKILVLILLAYPAAPTAAHDANPKSWTGIVRGEVMKIDGKIFIIQDSLDRKVRLEAGPNCTVDENIQAGDEIVAHIVHKKGKEKYIKSVKRLISSSPTGISAVVEGEILKIDRGTYLVLDPAGKEVRLQVDAKTWKDGNITVGDSILANIDNFQTVHAESLTKH
jgi:uncharacterized protein YdeI (BOF family)